MLNFGWAELFVIVVVAIFVMGPKEIPQIMYGFGRFVRRLQYLRFALSQQFDDFMEEHDLNELRDGADLRVIGDTQSEIEADEELTQKEKK